MSCDPPQCAPRILRAQPWQTDERRQPTARQRCESLSGGIVIDDDRRPLESGPSARACCRARSGRSSLRADAARSTHPAMHPRRCTAVPPIEVQRRTGRQIAVASCFNVSITVVETSGLSECRSTFTQMPAPARDAHELVTRVRRRIRNIRVAIDVPSTCGAHCTLTSIASRKWFSFRDPAGGSETRSGHTR